MNEIQIFIASMSRLTSAVCVINSIHTWNPNLLGHYDPRNSNSHSVFMTVNRVINSWKSLTKSLAFKHDFPIAAFNLRPATTDWRQAKHSAGTHSAWGAALGSTRLMQFERVTDEVYMERKQNNWLHLESNRHESTRLDSTGLCHCQQPYVLHPDSASVA